MKYAEYIFRQNDIVNVLVCKDSKNTKLGDHIIIGTYHFSIDQIENVDITQDEHNCMDCPFSYNRNNGKSGGCYTHKGRQRMGLNTMLKRLKKLDIKPYCHTGYKEFINKAKNVKLVRFGIYGEPIFLPKDMIAELSKIGENWTGYTHQWNKDWAKPYSLYFMASVHSQFEAAIAKDMGYRSFMVTLDEVNGAVNCPASKEAGRKAVCATCGLCSGSEGKGSKDIFILEH